LKQNENEKEKKKIGKTIKKEKAKENN